MMAFKALLAVEYSAVNDKDAMAVTDCEPVIRQLPTIPGIDFAGIAEASTYPGSQSGDRDAAGVRIRVH